MQGIYGMGFWRVRQGAMCQRQIALICTHTHGALFDAVGQWCCWLTLSSSGGFARRHRATARLKNQMAQCSSCTQNGRVFFHI